MLNGRLQKRRDQRNTQRKVYGSPFGFGERENKREKPLEKYAQEAAVIDENIRRVEGSIASLQPWMNCGISRGRGCFRANGACAIASFSAFRRGTTRTIS